MQCASQYLLPMVGGMIDGYYDIEDLKIATRGDDAALRLRLGEYHKLGDKWVQIYRAKMQPGECISLDKTMEMYEH